MDRILNNIYLYIKWKDGRRCYLKGVWIPNRLRTSIFPGSNDEGDDYGDGNEPNKYMKNKRFCTSSALFLYNLYEHNRKFPFATGTNSITSLIPNLGAVPNTP